MKKYTKYIMAVLLLLVFSLSACSTPDKGYGVESDVSSVTSVVKDMYPDVSRPAIMSSDRVMSKFVDISLFDEENYSEIYLGKKFKFNATYAENEYKVPTTINAMKKMGWKLVSADQHDEESLVYACESVDAVFENEKGEKISALFFNSSNSSVKLKKCSIVKFKIENNFYSNAVDYTGFNINGINNKMAVTDVIDILGTPSHFYPEASDKYYLDYFISEDDRRNGITVYINTTDDLVTAVEFSNYK